MTDQPPFLIQYTITAGGSVDAMRLAQSRLFRIHAIGDGFVIVAGLIGVATGYSGAFAFVVAGGLLLIESRTSLLQRWFVARRGRSVIGQVGEMTIGHDGVAFRMPHAQGLIAWSALTGVLADGRSVAFVRDRILSAYIPSTAFASRTEEDELVAYSRSRIAATR